MSTSTIDAPVTKVSSIRQPLTALDRCDACGAQAYVAVTVNNSELLWCAHHATKFESKIKAVASSWHDERSKLNAQR